VHVVVADDEVRLVELITRYLEEVGFITTGCYNGRDALTAAYQFQTDVMVLDVMMPGMSGLEVTRALRRQGVEVPILLLTARGAVTERVAGLEAGADDYLVKPFAMEELVARLNVFGRRLEQSGSRISLGDVVLDPSELRVWVGEDELELPRRQFTMLEELMRNPGRVLSRQRLFDAVWEGEVDIRSNALEVHVSRLRARLSHAEGVVITTVRGRGYRLEATGTKTDYGTRTRPVPEPGAEAGNGAELP
jgi:DNA-binding response OmpR family regulator